MGFDERHAQFLIRQALGFLHVALAISVQCNAPC